MCGHSAPRTFPIVNSLVLRDRNMLVTRILGDLQYMWVQLKFVQDASRVSGKSLSASHTVEEARGD